jgi:putative aminopeptidase FrvX
MATNVDSFPITAAMLAYAYVKPAVSFTTVAGKATTTDVYLPATIPEYAGARGGVSAAVSTDPNYAFAATIDAGQERTPYPNTVTTVAAVECNATLTVTNVES